jgi:autophagy-related protein 11
VKAFAQLQQMSVHPGSGSKGTSNLADSILSPGILAPRSTLSPLREEPPPIDPTDPAAALEMLRAYDLDAFAETVTKVGSVTRKLLKQCKDYRERAKGKISFRNFAKGDLALFLPTRNSQSKPWAAFNGAILPFLGG